MIRVLYVALAILAFIEIYSVGVMFLAKKAGESDYKKCMIPFYAFYVINRLTGIFRVFTIPVQKFHGMMEILCTVILLATLYACWGDTNLPIESSKALWEIMGVVILLCALVVWSGLIVSSGKIFRRFNVKKEGIAKLLSAFVITIPFQYLYYAKNNLPRDLKDMY